MNEWGRVKRVLIGTATRAKLPRVNEHTRYVYYADRDADSVASELERRLESLLVTSQEQGNEQEENPSDSDSVH